MIEVCIGSACHLKGSYDVIQRLKALVSEHNLQEKVELKSAFCLGACGEGDGVSIRINNDQIYSIQPSEVDSFFIKQFLGDANEIH